MEALGERVIAATKALRRRAAAAAAFAADPAADSCDAADAVADGGVASGWSKPPRVRRGGVRGGGPRFPFGLRYDPDARTESLALGGDGESLAGEWSHGARASDERVDSAPVRGSVFVPPPGSKPDASKNPLNPRVGGENPPRLEDDAPLGDRGESRSRIKSAGPRAAMAATSGRAAPRPGPGPCPSSVSSPPTRNEMRVGAGGGVAAASGTIFSSPRSRSTPPRAYSRRGGLKA